MNQPDDQAAGHHGLAPDSLAETAINQDPAPATAADDPPLPLTPEEELRLARDELTSLRQEAEKFQDLYVRERADLENFKRRTQRERADTLRFAVEPMARDLLIVVDNLERALAHTQGGDPALVEGVKLVYKSLLEVLERHAVQRIDASGAIFDPNRHEAIAQVESPDHEPNQVVTQHQAGYLLHDRLLRPAMVSVCGRKSNPDVATTPERD